MDILFEKAEPGDGEYDFWFSSDAQAAIAKEALTKAGFLVGGGPHSEHRATIATDSVMCKTNVDDARTVIMLLPNVKVSGLAPHQEETK